MSRTSTISPASSQRVSSRHLSVHEPSARMRSEVVGSVCPLSHISPMERLFVLKTLSRTQRATKIKTFVGFSLKPLRCRDPAPPPLYG